MMYETRTYYHRVSSSLHVPVPLSAASTLKTDLISYWEFEDTNWTDSHGSNTLTGTNSPTVAAGKVGNGVVFVDASNQLLSCTSNSSLQITGTDFTIVGWFKGTAHQFVDIWKKQDVTSGAWLGTFSGTGVQLRGVIHGNGEEKVVFGDTFGALSTGVWYFCVMRYVASTRVMSISVNAGGSDSAAPLTLGNEPGDQSTDLSIGSIFNDGLLDQVGFWKRYLSDSEITQLYNGGNGLAYSAM